MQAREARTFRLFYALWPDKRSRKALASLAAEVARAGQGRAPREENVHLTLAFLGEVPAPQLDALLSLGGRVATEAQSFALALDHVGGTSYRLAWVAPAEYNEPLHALQASLARALADEGFALERRMFRPHVTLARDCVRSVHRGPIPPIGWRVERLSLVASTPGRGGSAYRDIGEWPLRGVGG
jgi:2'-5' RNA ligase